MAFRVGQKVVCVSAPEGGYGDEERPVVGSVYTIRGIEHDRPYEESPIGIFLEEIINAPRAYRGYPGLSEVSFAPRRFRPLVERKTDISIFEAMLTGTKKRRVLAQGEEVKS